MGDDVRILWSSTAMLWSFFGVLAGALFGAAGGLSHDRRPWLRAIAVAMPGAVLLAEAATLVNRSDEPGADRTTGPTAWSVEASCFARPDLAVRPGQPGRIHAVVATPRREELRWAGRLGG
jgi:hypothetical protein